MNKFNPDYKNDPLLNAYAKWRTTEGKNVDATSAELFIDYLMEQGNVNIFCPYHTKMANWCAVTKGECGEVPCIVLVRKNNSVNKKEIEG